MKMKQTLTSNDDNLEIGDRVRLIPETPAWSAEIDLQGKIGEVIERRDDGRVTVRYDNGRLLMGHEAEVFERLVELGLKAKK